MKSSFVVCYMPDSKESGFDIQWLHGISCGGGYCSRESYHIGPGLKDVKLPDIISSLDPTTGFSDSSVAVVTEKGLQAKCDYWGIHPLYYYRQDDVFIISDSIYSIVKILGRIEKDSDGFFDYLFFSVPLGDKTWFRDIKCLEPDQSIRWENNSKRLVLSERNNFEDLFSPVCRDTIHHAVEKYFESIVSSGKEIALSISYGSDSRTLLACLRNYGIEHKCYCFGRDNYAETQNTRLLLNKFGQKLDYVRIEDTKEWYFDALKEAVIQSNGLINPLRVHYYDYYEKIPGGSNCMEGILGSEFIKGEISTPTMTSDPVLDVVFRGNSIESTVRNRMSFLSKSDQDAMIHYLLKKYPKLLNNANAHSKRTAYVRYLFDTLPSKVFGGVIQLACQKHRGFYPYLQSSILCAVFSSKFGITNYSSLESSFPGAIRCVVPEAMIVKEMDSKIYHSVLDRGISFAEAQSRMGYINRKARSLVKRITRNRNKFYGQIDNTEVVKWINESADRAGFENSHNMSEHQKRVLWYYNIVTGASI